MKTFDIIILSLCVGFFVIAVYETIAIGLTTSYLWFMISMGLLFYYSFRRRWNEEEEEQKEQVQKSKRKRRQRNQ